MNLPPQSLNPETGTSDRASVGKTTSPTAHPLEVIGWILFGLGVTLLALAFLYNVSTYAGGSVGFVVSAERMGTRTAMLTLGSTGSICGLLLVLIGLVKERL